MPNCILKKGLVFLSVSVLILTLAALITEAQSQFEAIKLEDIRSASLSSARIPGQSLVPNTIILFRTDEGRLGKLLIKSSETDLILAWVTFDSAGTIHSRGDNLIIRRTYTCDLDTGRESQASADFWWQIASASERYLTPRNGAAFAIYIGSSQPPTQKLIIGQQVKTAADDTSKTVESSKQAGKASQIQIKEKLSGLFKKSEQQISGQFTSVTGEPPASFQRVTYRFKDGVMVIRREKSQRFINNLKVAEEVTQEKTLSLTPKMKLQQGALIERRILVETGISALERNKIIYDETTKLAAKVTGQTSLRNREYLTLSCPQIYEVLDEFEIPQQTVTLTSGNITPLTPPDVQFQYRRTSTGAISLRSRERWHIKDPWLMITFDDVPLVAYTSEGRSINVRLSGRIGLTPIRVDGRYTGFSGYEFKLSSGEEISLKVTVAMNIKEDLKIPLFAIDIPAAIATIRGGFYLLVGVDGSFTLVAEATEWLEAEAGVRGGTFLWIPTGFDPFFNLNKGFESDAYFAGQINGYIKGGPLVEIELLGWDLLGAGGLVGMGIDCQVLGSGSDSILDVDIYGSIELYAALFGKRINLVNNTFSLYHLQKPNTAGYDVRYLEVCAWRRVLWGELKKDLGNGQFEPVAAHLTFEVKKLNNEGKEEKYYATGRSDAEGKFKIDFPFALYYGDKIRLIKVGDTSINSSAAAPTIPFKRLRIEYADFFNDVCRGQVEAAMVKNWTTGEWEQISYTGNIRLNNGARTTCDGDGNFLLSYDFKPGENVIASIDFNGFVVNSPPLQTDVAFLGKRFIEASNLSEYTESSGRLVEKRVDREHFQVVNLRGQKQPSLPGNYQADYFHYVTLSQIFEYFTGRPIIPPRLLETKNYSFRLSPCDSGAAELVQDFTEEWSWVADSTIKGGMQVQKAPGVLSKVGSEIKMARGAQFAAGSVPFFRYDSDKTRAQGNPVDEGVQCLVRIGKLFFNYEGAEIEVQDLSEKQVRQGHEPPRSGVNPGLREVLDRIDSRINPGRLSRLDPISSRVNLPLNQIRIQQEVRR